MSDLFVDNIKHQSSQGSGTINVGASGETVQAGSGVDNKIGIGDIDYWMTNADQSISAGTSTLVSGNWVRVSEDNDFEKTGDGMTVSSGIWTFPRTGKYLITFSAEFSGTSSSNYRYVQTQILTTNDNSTYDNLSIKTNHYGAESISGFISVVNQTIFDVRDTTNYKVKLHVQTINSATLYGVTSDARTQATWIRLGDT